MDNLRKYGDAPFSVAVVHGGPGAAGEMAPVARELAASMGVLEPIQTATSLNAQVEELNIILKEHGDGPVTLIGFSWGAWLSFILAARYPVAIKKLILVGSGPFEENYVGRIQEIRLSRFSEEERDEYRAVIKKLNDPDAEDKPKAFARLGALASKADVYDPIVNESGSNESDLCKPVGVQGNIFHNVLQEAQAMRRTGELLELAKHIACPVVAIHGEHDTHPPEGVQNPLASIVKDFRFVLLKNCGHKPWIERQAKEDFFQILKGELP